MKVTYSPSARSPLPALRELHMDPSGQRINVDRFDASKVNVPANAEYFQNQLGMIIRVLGH